MAYTKQEVEAIYKIVLPTNNELDEWLNENFFVPNCEIVVKGVYKFMQYLIKRLDEKLYNSALPEQTKTNVGVDKGVSDYHISKLKGTKTAICYFSNQGQWLAACDIIDAPHLKTQGNNGIGLDGKPYANSLMYFRDKGYNIISWKDFIEANQSEGEEKKTLLNDFGSLKWEIGKIFNAKIHMSKDGSAIEGNPAVHAITEFVSALLNGMAEGAEEWKGKYENLKASLPSDQKPKQWDREAFKKWADKSDKLDMTWGEINAIADYIEQNILQGANK